MSAASSRASVCTQMLNGKEGFLSTDRLKKFSKHRNDPNQPEALSNLSPYYHFGHLAAQRAALEASKLRSKAKVTAHPQG